MKGYYWWKSKCYRLCVQNPASELLQIGLKPEKWQWRHNSLTWHHRQFFCVVLFLLSSLVTGPSFMLMSPLVLELWQFSFIRDWLEIRKSEKSPSVFCLISGDWGWVSDAIFGKNVSNKMLLNPEKCQGYNFYLFWVIKGKPRVKLLPPPRLG